METSTVKNIPNYLIATLLLLCTSLAGQAREFKVKSFRSLPNDVSAFINRVTDLNEDACALIKIEAPPECAFSTPLGIVKRIDHTGEIWLYIPKGSKKITLKHPRWGVIRDYQFPIKIESNLTYELRIEAPEEKIAISSTTASPVIVHDTLVVTHTDTLLMATHPKKIPFATSVIATAGFGGSSNSLSAGLMAVIMKRHGGFIHCSTDFGNIGTTDGQCDKNGWIGGRLPYYSGKTRHAFLLATAGGAHRLSDKFSIFEGLGYGYDDTAWQLAKSEGGTFVKNKGYSHRGLAFEIGALFHIRKLTLSASAASIGGTQWYGMVGIGFTFHSK